MAAALDLAKTYSAIVVSAKNHKFITYGEIAAASNVEWNLVRYDIGRHLRDLLEIGYDNDWPLITSIIVDQGSVETGELKVQTKDALIEVAEDLGYEVGDRDAFITSQQNAIFAWANQAPGKFPAVVAQGKRDDARFMSYMGPILDALRAMGGAAKPQDVFEWLKDNIEIPDTELDRTYTNGSNAFTVHANKAAVYLRRSALLDSLERGVWTASKVGNSTHLEIDDSRGLAQSWRARKKAKAKQDESASISSAPSTEMVDAFPKNLILFGPPGTGKTYKTIDHAVRVLDSEYYDTHQSSRGLIQARFNDLRSQGKIGFVTFHQSFSYEEFVEGLKVENEDGGQLSYNVVDGIFKRLSVAASSQVTKSSSSITDIEGFRTWKMSLVNPTEEVSYIYDECIANNYILLGYGYGLDYSSARTREQITTLQSGVNPDVQSGDYTVSSVDTFINLIKPGDFVVISDGNSKFRAIGRIKTEYRYLSRDDGQNYCQCRDVEWLRVYNPSLPCEELIEKFFSQMTLYELRHPILNLKKLADLLSEKTHVDFSFRENDAIGDYVVKKVTLEVLTLTKPQGSILQIPFDMLIQLAELVESKAITIEDIRKKSVFDKVEGLKLEKYIVHGYSNILPRLVEIVVAARASQVTKKTDGSARVLIIDEINRGNVAKIFGELITLIEPNKRLGREESLTVTLPYSKTTFGVPDNLYIIGTMNTADRSLVSIDAALRRRFVFEEVLPEPALLRGLFIEGTISLEKILTSLNNRIELLLGTEYQIGHSDFLTLRKDLSFASLKRVFQGKIIPLLQEYFFDDWEKIHRVLGDHQKPEHLWMVKQQFTDSEVSILLGPDWQNNNSCWKVNLQALDDPDSYRGIYEKI